MRTHDTRCDESRSWPRAGRTDDTPCGGDSVRAAGPCSLRACGAPSGRPRGLGCARRVVSDRCHGGVWPSFAGGLVAALRRPIARESRRRRIAGQSDGDRCTGRAAAGARALREVAAAALFPPLGSSASVQRSTGRSGATPASGRTTTHNFQAGLDANWELDIFDVKRNALASGEATARASEVSLGDVQVSIAAELALAYITLRNAQARLVIANANLASQQETLQITQWRQQAGLVTSLEAEQARAAAEQTGALVPALQVGSEQASHALTVLSGRASAKPTRRPTRR